MKPNIIICGPQGAGKTMLIDAIINLAISHIINNNGIFKGDLPEWLQQVTRFAEKNQVPNYSTYFIHDVDAAGLAVIKDHKDFFDTKTPTLARYVITCSDLISADFDASFLVITLTPTRLS